MLAFVKRAAVAVVAASCGMASAQVRLQGAGATFPEPLYQRWVSEYQKSHPLVQIDYKGIGSGGGIKGITDKTLDFAGSDAPMSSSERQKAGDEVVHIPTVAGAVVPAYNLPGVSGELKLTGPVIADIYRGVITKWNDSKIAAINAGLTLPDMEITPVYRTDGSGTSFIFTNYLAGQSSEFKDGIGAGKTVQWPVGQGGKGNQGVTAVVQTTPGRWVTSNWLTPFRTSFPSLWCRTGTGSSSRLLRRPSRRPGKCVGVDDQQPGGQHLEPARRKHLPDQRLYLRHRLQGSWLPEGSAKGRGAGGLP